MDVHNNLVRVHESYHKIIKVKEICDSNEFMCHHEKVGGGYEQELKNQLQFQVNFYAKERINGVMLELLVTDLGSGDIICATSSDQSCWGETIDGFYKDTMTHIDRLRTR